MSLRVWTVLFGIVYIMFFVGLGFYYRKKARSVESFLLADRGIGFWAMVGTVIGTSIGGSSIAGYCDYGLTYGLGGYWMVAATYWVMPIFVIYFSKRLRHFSLFTIPDIFGERYDNKTRVVTSLMIALQQAGVLAVQIVALAKVMQILFGVSYLVGALIGTIVLIIYCTQGGLKAVVTAEGVNSVVLCATLLILVVVVLAKLGGPVEAITAAPAGAWSITRPGWVKITSWILTYAPGCMIWQSMWQRSYAAADDKSASSGMLVGFLIVSLIMFVPFIVGPLAPNILPEVTYGTVFVDLLSAVFPTPVAAFMLIGWTAAIMSTGDSYVLSAASNITRDIYQMNINRKATPEQVLKVSKASVFGLLVLAFVLSIWLPDLMALWILFTGCSMAVVFWPIVGAWWCRRANAAGAFSAALTGFIVYVVWVILGGFADGYLGYPAVFVAFPIAGIVFFAVSYLTKPPAPEKAKAYWWDEMESKKNSAPTDA